MQLTVETYDLEYGDPEDFGAEARQRLRENLRLWHKKFSVVSNSAGWQVPLDEVTDVVFEAFWAEVIFTNDMLRVAYLEDDPWDEPFFRTKDDPRQVEAFLGLDADPDRTSPETAMEMARSLYVANDEEPEEDMLTWMRHFAALPSACADGLKSVLNALPDSLLDLGNSPSVGHYRANLVRQMSFERMRRVSDRLSSCALPAGIGELTAKVIAAETRYLTRDLRFFDYPEMLCAVIDTLDGHVRDELSLGIAQTVVDAAQGASDILDAIDALKG